MKLFNIEILSNIDLEKGDLLYLNIVKDEMAMDNATPNDKYLLRFTTEDGKLFGFGLKTSLFSKHSSSDVINFIFDKKIKISDNYKARVLSKKILSQKNKPLYQVEILDFIIESNKRNIESRSKTSKKTPVLEKDIIIDYLNKNKIPKYLIDSIISQHIAYDNKYKELIPSLSNGLKPWDSSKDKDNLLLLAIIQMEEGLNMRFVGGKGSGKDTLLYTLGWIYQRPIFSLPTNRDTTTFDLFGDKTIGNKIINDKHIQYIEFKKGPLIEAMEIGGIFEFGEGNSCNPEVSISLHTILDHRRSIDVPGYKFVKAHNSFRFIMTMNLGYIGCNSLNQAFMDRFSTLKFKSTNDIKNILINNCPEASVKNIEICNKIYKSLLGIAEEFQDEDFITIRGYINALKMSKHIPIYNAIECCVVNSLSDDESVTKKALQIVDNIIER